MGLDTIEFLMHAEKAFDIKITDAEAGEVTTIGQFSALCHSKIKQKSAAYLTEEDVFLKLCQILQQHYGVTQPIQREHLIVKDLGLD